MPRKPAPPATLHQKSLASRPAREMLCPFTVAIDTREQRPFAFEGLRGNADKGSLPIVVRTARVTLSTGRGDYSIVELPTVGVERKSLADLYGSIAQGRENFARRLALMSEGLAPGGAHVVVEAEPFVILNNPPPHTRMDPRALWRTILAWQVRHPLVTWHFLPDRGYAEGQTFRILERFWEDHHARAARAPADRAD